MDRVIMRWNLQKGYSAMDFLFILGNHGVFCPEIRRGAFGIFSGRHSQSQKLTQYKGFKGF